jgi:hypothetical protein
MLFFQSGSTSLPAGAGQTAPFASKSNRSSTNALALVVVYDLDQASAIVTRGSKGRKSACTFGTSVAGIELLFGFYVPFSMW